MLGLPLLGLTRANQGCQVSRWWAKAHGWWGEFFRCPRRVHLGRWVVGHYRPLGLRRGRHRPGRLSAPSSNGNARCTRRLSKWQCKSHNAAGSSILKCTMLQSACHYTLDGGEQCAQVRWSLLIVECTNTLVVQCILHTSEDKLRCTLPKHTMSN